jgi:Holliday junction resolvase-like predicted endonuclease
VRTSAQRAGDGAEAFVEGRLVAAGWTMLARRLRVGRAELDLLAIDPGPPSRLVAVEVRWRGRRDFGIAEESLDWRKAAHLRGAIGRLVTDGRLGDGRPLPAMPMAVDLVVVEPHGGGGRALRLRHHRDVLAG